MLWIWGQIAVFAVILFSDVCTSMSTTKIAVAQLCSTSQKLQNLLHIATCARQANREGCSFLFLPECCGFMGESSEQTLMEAEAPIGTKHQKNPAIITRLLEECVREDDKATVISIQEALNSNPRISIVDGLKTIAKESSQWISAGGIHVSADDSEPARRVFNTHVIFNSDGTIVSYYRKIHLFDVFIPNKVDLRESKTTFAGSELVLCDSPIGRLGLSTCYDVRFPELYVDLVEQGAEVLLVPSAFTIPTGTVHWEVLLRARAIESQCFVIAAAQVGQHNGKRASYGHSLVVDPWGKVLADAGGAWTSEQTPFIVTSEIDLKYVRSVREKMPIQNHRKKADRSRV